MMPLEESDFFFKSVHRNTDSLLVFPSFAIKFGLQLFILFLKHVKHPIFVWELVLQAFCDLLKFSDIVLHAHD